MTAQSVPMNSRQRSAILLISSGTVLWIGMPVLVALTGHKMPPIVFTAIWKLCAVGFLLTIIAAVYRDVARNHAVRAATFRAMKTPAFVVVACAEADVLLFMWAATTGSTAVASVLFETWPMWLIAFSGWLFRGEHRYARFKRSMLPPALGVLVGACLVGVSHTGTDGAVLDARSVAVAAMGAAAAAVFAVKMALTVRLGTVIGRESLAAGAGADVNRVEASAALFVSAMSSVPLVVIGLLWIDEIHAVPPLALTAVCLGGIVINGGTRLCFRLANVLTSNLDINFIPALAPVGSVAALLLLGLADGANVMLLVTGTVLVVAGNIWLRLPDVHSRMRRAR